MATDTTPPVAPEVWPDGTWTTKPQVSVQTSLGTFVIGLEPASATYTVVNFLAYVNTGFYSNLTFHRVIPGFMIQGGGFKTGLVQKTATYSAIPLEANNGLGNLRGTVAMARTSAPNSATSQFFVNLVDNAFLNYPGQDGSGGYAVFGNVVSGLSVVDKIAKVATHSVSGFTKVPTKDVTILSAKETLAATVVSTNGDVYAFSLEKGGKWEYSLDKGTTWKAGKATTNGVAIFTLPVGAYEAGTVLVRQKDAAGNVSKIGKPGANIVVDDHASVIAGDQTANVLTGTSSDDALYGLAAADSLQGAAGNDLLDGGSGIDTLVGGDGDDLYFARQANQVIQETEGAGTDSVVSFLASFTLPDNIENARFGIKGAATLIGNALDNVLTAGAGQNHLAGGVGSDTFKFDSAASAGRAVATADVIDDFTTGDRIDLSLLDANTTTAGDDAFAAGLVASFTAPGQLKFQDGVLSGNMDADPGTVEFRIVLTGVTAMTAADFIL